MSISKPKLFSGLNWIVPDKSDRDAFMGVEAKVWFVAYDDDYAYIMEMNDNDPKLIDAITTIDGEGYEQKFRYDENSYHPRTLKL
jgi:hypothetical protein